MSKIGEYLTSGLTIIFYLFIIYGEIFGIIHSVKHHSTGDVVASVSIPPWAWWRSLEMWWHDDYADIDWDKRLSNDMQTCIYFMAQANYQNINKFELNDDLEKFSKRVNKYPNEKRRFLIDGTRKYVSYSNSMQTDLINSMTDYFDSGRFEWELSSQTIRLENELKSFKLEKDVELMKKEFDELKEQMKENFPEDKELIDEYRLKEYKMTMKLVIETQRKELSRIFKNIFNEEL